MSQPAPDMHVPNQIADALQHLYGLQVRSAHRLEGEVDHNYLLHTDRGPFLAKCTPPPADTEAIDFQIALMEHLAGRLEQIETPRVVRGLDGRNWYRLPDGQVLRLQTWVEGRMLAEVRPRTTALLEQWGRVAGLLNAALADFDHPYAHRTYRWDPSRTLDSRPLARFFRSDEERALADWFWQLFEREAAPLLPRLRQGVNYNDAHEHNLLVSGEVCQPRISGVIDFGDSLHTHTVNELAIACAYACMGMADPLAAACAVVRGFHAVRPLEEDELKVLYPLVAARLLLTVTAAAQRRHEQPDNAYLFVSEAPAWDLLRRWREIPPALAWYAFRQTTGLEPVPQRSQWDAFVRRNPSFHPVVVPAASTALLDLSVGSTDLGHPTGYATTEAFAKTIDRMLAEQGARMGFGGYGEVRPFYTTDAYVQHGNDGRRWRTVHLGLDIWAPAGTPVHAPARGRLHSFADNARPLDYGPCIVLEHDLPEGGHWYTLYGHLSRTSLEGLYPGKEVQAGEVIATIGPPPENGQWPPHLHFQVVLDMLGHAGDFPGVAFPEAWPLWQALCPDPAPFFPPAAQHRPPHRLSADEILRKRKKHLGPNLSLSYDEPLHIVRGYLQHLYAADGRRYLDTVNNVPHVGHQHPRVVEAGTRQMAVLNTNTRYLHEEIVRFAEALAATLPDPLEVVYFVNSGSEANELAMRIARTATGARDMLVLETGYHGNTQGCIDVSSYKFDGPGGSGAPPHVHVLPMPDTYRGLYREPATAGPRYAAHVAQVLDRLARTGKRPAAFLFESIMSCAGQIVLPKGFLSEACRLVRAAGGLCIADEVQTGLGRVGDAFWAFELHGIVPDIVTIGKPLGNGHPVAAVVTTRALADAFANGMEYFNTFGGNPVSCAIGRAVLAVIEEEQRQEHARRIGALLIEGLRALQTRHPVIGDVRGHGLFLGFELVRDPEARTPAPRKAHYLANRMRRLGFLMSTDGKDHNVIKIKPPLCFDQNDAELLLDTLDRVLDEDCMRL